MGPHPASQYNFSDPFEINDFDVAVPSNASDADDASGLQDAADEVQFAPTFEWSREASVSRIGNIDPTFELISSRSCFGLCLPALRRRVRQQTHV